MPDTEYASSQIDSIILGAAEKAALKEGVVLSAEVKNNLLTVAQARLNRVLEEEGTLEARRAQVEESTFALIHEAAEEHRRSGNLDPELTWKVVDDVLDRFCKMYPTAFPFCPRR
jgi:hypothetical protein